MPTQVTDVNGRVTTVHKRLDAVQKPQNGRKVPAPTLAPTAAVSASTETPIVMPDALTEKEYKAFYDWQRSFTSNSHYRNEVLAMFDEPFHAPTQALAWHIISSNSVPHKTVYGILGNYHAHRQSNLAKMFGHVQSDLLNDLRNKLLLAERLCRKNSPDDVSEYWLTDKFLTKAIEGYHYTPKEEDRGLPAPIATEEELESIAAVSSFLIRALSAGNVDQFKEKTYRGGNGKKVIGMYMANRSLDAYLRTAPEDADRAIEYAVTRKIGNTVKDTKQLMEYLRDTEDAVAINEGWL